MTCKSNYAWPKFENEFLTGQTSLKMSFLLVKQVVYSWAPPLHPPWVHWRHSNGNLTSPTSTFEFTDVIQTEILPIICIEAIIDLGHLRNVALLLHAQRSSRHKNCRNCGIINISQTWFSIPTYCNSLGYRKLSQRMHVLLLWWSGIVVTALRPLKSAIWEYISPRINFRLIHSAHMLLHWIIKTRGPTYFLL